MKDRGQMSTAIVVSLDGRSQEELKIVMLRIDGCEVTSTTLGSITKDGMTYIRTHGWNKMFESSGLRAIAEQKETGDEQ